MTHLLIDLLSSKKVVTLSAESRKEIMVYEKTKQEKVFFFYHLINFFLLIRREMY